MTDRLEVGRISKAHGLRGDLIFQLYYRPHRGAHRSRCRVVLDGEPFTVVSGQVHGKKWLVRLKECTTKEQADSLRGRIVSADPLDDVDAVFVHELIGKRLVDQRGTDHGPVVSVIDNPASDLLELEDGALVPLAFYQALDGDKVLVDVPDGLFDE
ncbi:MAG: hypothetical protein R2706_04200 [Acidimicrobiales bacterium]